MSKYDELVYATLIEIVKFNKIETTCELIKYLVEKGVDVDQKIIRLTRNLYEDNFIK